MSWSLLRTNYTDAVWSGLKKYTQINNSDGTISLNDVTIYTNRENSFFGAKDANRINEALNYIMSCLEDGTDLYQEFQTYFNTQKNIFRNSANGVIENVQALTNEKYDSYKIYVDDLKLKGNSSLTKIEEDYEKRMTSYENEQKASFDKWFSEIQNSLSSDVNANFQNQLLEIDERLSNLEYMTLQNSFIALLRIDNNEETILTDDAGYAIVADWKYKED